MTKKKTRLIFYKKKLLRFRPKDKTTQRTSADPQTFLLKMSVLNNLQCLYLAARNRLVALTRLIKMSHVQIQRKERHDLSKIAI